MSKTSIEWTDARWNPIRGCSRISEGCRNCYAERMAARFSSEGQPWGSFAETTRRGPSPFFGFAEMTKSGPHWTGRVEPIPSKLDEPLHWRKPRKVFVNSMSDLFHESLPFEDVSAVLRICWTTWRQTQGEDAIRDGDHTYQILTKRAGRMREYFRWLAEARPGSGSYLLSQAWPLPSVWLGVSPHDQESADRMIAELLKTPAAVRFVSLEPLLGSVDVRPFLPCRRCGGEGSVPVRGGGAACPACFEWAQGSRHPGPYLDQVIVGGESGPHARPCDVSWIRSIRNQCHEAGVACFVKQLGSHPVRECSSCAPGDAFCRLYGVDVRGEGHAEDRMLRVWLKHPKGGDPSEWPDDLRVREFPKCASAQSKNGG